MTAPLSRFRVLELGSTIAGPFCARLLADFGAEVIKVEDPGGDVIRSFGESFHGRSLYAASLLRNKRTIAVDLRSEAGRAVVRRLARRCDVVVENFRPGALEAWGLGYDVLSEDNPKLVMVRISGFGQTGPYSTRPGYGVISEAASGLRSITGYPDSPPARIATPLTDYLTGLYGAFGALVALLESTFSGKGQMVDAALSESAFSFMESFVPAYDKLGTVPVRVGSKLPGAAPNNLFTTADGEFIHIAAWHDSLFRRFCVAIGQPKLADDERFRDLPSRAKHSDALDDIVAQWAGTHDLATVQERLVAGDIPASKVFTIADIFRDPHYRARSALVRVPDETIGDVTLIAPVPKLSRTPGTIVHAGRDLGEDTRAVLADTGGYAEEEIDRLLADGAVRARNGSVVAT